MSNSQSGPVIDELCINTIRFLAAEAVEKAKSGHPGLPMGAAAMAHVLWSRHLRFDPKEPRWLGRDRFLLSAGHGSALLYALLHVGGYDVTLNDLQNFRQLGSRTPGHPEFGHTAGVEITSGPLGQGFANGVGFALGQAMLSAKLGPGNPVADHFIYAIVSDGDLMEGISYEAASFAGHNKLGRLIYLYDDNGITIDGKTTVSFSGEDVTRRFESQGWQVQSVDGLDLEGISSAIDKAKADLSRPSLIRVKNIIGYGAPKKQGTSGCHGSPLGEEEMKAAKENLKWPQEPKFFVPPEVRAHWEKLLADKAAQHRAWSEKTAAWRSANPEKAALLDAHVERKVPANIGAEVVAGIDAADATRKLNQAAINKVAALVPSLVGGSADLAESNLTDIKGAGAFSPETPAGRNIRYGIREHAMGAIANGLAFDGFFIPFTATFLIFSDYMRHTVRLAALSKIQAIYVWTHDSIYVGEDGPTHQPIEQLTSLRAIPNLHVVRPADGPEVAVAWQHALSRRDGPTGLILTRQKLAPVKRDSSDPALLARGGYVVSDPAGARATVIASGSEVATCQAALELLAAKGIKLRLVSIPCLACFEAQPAEYQRQVLPPSQKVCAVEVARGTEWWRYAGRDGLVIAMEGYGASGPDKAVAEKFGFTPAQIADRIAGWLNA